MARSTGVGVASSDADAVPGDRPAPRRRGPWARRFERYLPILLLLPSILAIGVFV